MSKDFEIRINKGALEKALKEAGAKAVKEQAPRLQRMLDSLHRSQAGKPLTRVKSAVQAGFRSIGGKITEPELTEYAKAISEGQKIVVKPEMLR